jgi:hypothetical protein
MNQGGLRHPIAEAVPARLASRYLGDDRERDIRTHAESPAPARDHLVDDLGHAEFLDDGPGGHDQAEGAMRHIFGPVPDGLEDGLRGAKVDRLGDHAAGA